MPEPIRLVPGKENADAPLLDDTVTADQWCAWLTIERDRATDRPSDRDILAVALDVDEPDWELWWDRPAAAGGGLTHRAAVIGATLVSTCGYSQHADHASTYLVTEHPDRDPRRTYCVRCQRYLAPFQ